MSLSAIEEETVFLMAVTDIIDSIMNHELLSVSGTDPDSQILFHSPVHQRLFNIILVDFLSRTDRAARVRQTTYLAALRSVASTPSFDVGGSVGALRQATAAFTEWLEQTVEVGVWLPSINATPRIGLSRVAFLKMCGDIAKHNFLRAVGVAKDLQKALAATGTSIELDDALLALAEFYERFHTDILNYHGSTIAAFLNNIRWGIFEYLRPELQRSLSRGAAVAPAGRYTIPADLNSEFARQCYLDLMNNVYNPPYVRRFEVTKWLTLRY